jgi:type VI secretion system secreted protein VgrG
MNAATIAMDGPKSMSTANLPDNPNASFNDKLRLANQEGKPYANTPYKLVRHDGSVMEGVTDAQGHANIVRNDFPEGFSIEILPSKA